MDPAPSFRCVRERKQLARTTIPPPTCLSSNTFHAMRAPKPTATQLTITRVRDEIWRAASTHEGLRGTSTSAFVAFVAAGTAMMFHSASMAEAIESATINVCPCVLSCCRVCVYKCMNVNVVRWIARFGNQLRVARRSHAHMYSGV